MKYHYTLHENIKAILASGVIKLSEFVPHKSHAAVWFSTNHVWEATSTRMYLKTPVGVVMTSPSTSRGIYWRIVVEDDVALTSFNKWCAGCGVEKRERAHLVGAAAKVGSDKRDWWCSLSEVPLERIVRLEHSDFGVWIEASGPDVVDPVFRFEGDVFSVSQVVKDWDNVEHTTITKFLKTGHSLSA